MVTSNIHCVLLLGVHDEEGWGVEWRGKTTRY